MTFSIMTIECHYAERCYAEYRDYINVKLSVIMPNVVMLNVFMLSVIMPNVKMIMSVI